MKLLLYDCYAKAAYDCYAKAATERDDAKAECERLKSECDELREELRKSRDMVCAAIASREIYYRMLGEQDR